MKLQRAGEDYLEAMLFMKERHGYIRSVDIADYLGVTKPSVTYSTKRLRENGYITMDKEGLITLTETGMTVATKLGQRHKTLMGFLVSLGVDPEVAEADACKIEHDVSEETFRAICRLAVRDDLLGQLSGLDVEAAAPSQDA